MNNVSSAAEEELSLKTIIFIILEWLTFLRSKLLAIFAFLIVGILIGLLYSLLSDKNYTAKTSFVLQESGDNVSSQIPSGLAFLGINLRNESGLFTGTSLIWLYTSKPMLTKTLMTKVDSSGKEELLIDWFIEIDDDLKELYTNIKDSNPAFALTQSTSNDSLINIQKNQVLARASDIIRKKYLTISNDPDANAIISVTFTSTDELFSKLFLEKLVDNVSISYIETKTQRTMDQIQLLENKINDLSSSLTSSMVEVATSSNSNPNLNPIRQVLKVESQKQSIDVQANSSIYIQMVQQLEASKLTLSKETPLIQIVEEPLLPLEVKEVSLIKSIIIGGILAVIIGVILLTFIRYINNLIVDSHGSR